MVQHGPGVFRVVCVLGVTAHLADSDRKIQEQLSCRRPDVGLFDPPHHPGLDFLADPLKKLTAEKLDVEFGQFVLFGQL